MKEFISICIPTFNSGLYLEECLNSISFATSNYNFIDEILFCDNTSCDSTLNIINEFVINNNKARIISYSDEGQSDAINKAIKVVRSDYFMWLNSDDILHPNFLEIVFYKLLNKGDMNYFTISADILNIDENSNFLSRSPCIADSILYLNYGFWFGSFPCRIFYTKIIKELKLDVNLEYSMDFDLVYRASLLSLPDNCLFATNVNEYLGYFRHHSGSKTTSGKFDFAINLESLSVRKKSVFISFFVRIINFSYLYRRFLKKYKLVFS